MQLPANMSGAEKREKMVSERPTVRRQPRGQNGLTQVGGMYELYICQKQMLVVFPGHSHNNNNNDCGSIGFLVSLATSHATASILLLTACSFGKL